MTPFEYRLRLLRADYDPLPVFGKKPALKAWEKHIQTSEGDLDIWSKVYPTAQNTGVLCRRMPTLDADILNSEASQAIEDLVRDRYEADRGHVLVRIGNPPKRAFPFQTDRPFSKLTANLIAPNGSSEKIEFLCDGQQVVVDGIHPDTHRPYRWFGGEPGQLERSDLPYIGPEEAHELVEVIVDMLVRDFGYQRARQRPKGNRKGNGGTAPDAEDDAKRAAADDWSYLYNNILTGKDLHDSITVLAAKMVVSGMNPGAAVNQLRSLMENSSAPRDQRWHDRYVEIPRAVDSAVDKYKLDVGSHPQSADPDPNISLAEVHNTFRKWLGEKYDTDVLDAVAAAGASERLKGDPLWLLVIAGPGAAKTETVQSLSGAGAYVTSTISSEGALLSASPHKQKKKGATGGLLRKIGARGIVVIKDVTSILSADRNTRACVLAAIREIFDGRWERNVGTDGGMSLTWEGRVVIVGAVTTAWDMAHAVIAAMGDRFVLIRADSRNHRADFARQAIRNTGSETTMRIEMAQAVGALIANAGTDEYQLADAEMERLVSAANVVTWARTGVERDYRGDVILDHDPELPTRFVKQLVQLVRGAVAIGKLPDEALKLALRCARDSLPPLRRELLIDIATYPDSTPRDVYRRVGRPRTTVRRELEALHMLRIRDETDVQDQHGNTRTAQKYRIATTFDSDTLLEMVKLDQSKVQLDRRRKASSPR